MQHRTKSPSFQIAKWWMAFIISLCLVIAGCSPPPVNTGGDLAAFTTQLDKRVPKWLRQYRVPGAAVALVRRGEVVWSKGYGLADKERGVPVIADAVHTDTVFQVASISKSVTVWGVMRLVQNGQLALDAPVEQYLTRWHLPPSDYDANGVTIRRLLSHSAGLSLHGYPGLPPDRSLPSLEDSLSGNNGGAGDVRIVMEPGAQYSYSGGGYTLLQLVIEEVTGQSFSDYMQREILDPLGMSSSSFEWRADLQPLTAVGYDAAGRPYPNYLFTEKAAAGLYTTAVDLARFVAAEMLGADDEAPGRGVLEPEILDLMFTPVVSLQGVEKFLGGSMGLGHFVETLPDGTKAVSHGGANQGWQLQFMALPERGEGIVILTNSDQGADIGVEAMRVWGRWLGTGAPSSCNFYQTVGTIALCLAILLGGILIFKIADLFRQVRDGSKQWLWRLPVRPKGRGYVSVAFFVLFSLASAAIWRVGVHPILSALAFRQAGWLTLVMLCLFVFNAVAALLRSPAGGSAKR
ncbi:MAG: beta-lactamase family protein [Anaerolineae bacterium]|nr:beta-lactamase family protein [Anaerolineae bacterium]